MRLLGKKIKPVCMLFIRYCSILFYSHFRDKRCVYKKKFIENMFVNKQTLTISKKYNAHFYDIPYFGTVVYF